MTRTFYFDWDNIYDSISTTFHKQIQNHTGSNFPKINAWVKKSENEGDKKQLYIEASLSGYKPEEVNIEVDASESTLTFEYKNVDQKDETEYLLKEIKKSSFRRELVIPQSVNLNTHTAEYKDGIVTIIFDLKTDEELGKKKIKIG